MSLLYHFTSEAHLPGILESRAILPTESNIGSPSPDWQPYGQNVGPRVGKARILMIRSQDGTPCAIFAGDEVSVYSTDVPKSTEFVVDKKLLVVYRADYTVYDASLLK